MENNEYCMQMDGTRNYRPGSSNSDPKPYSCYVLTNKFILVKEVQNNQDSELKESNNQRAQSDMGGRRK